MKKAISILLAAALALLMAGCGDPAAPTFNDPTTAPETTATPERFDPVEPIPVENETVLDTYDLTGDGKADALRIHCAEPWEYQDWGDFGYHWQILINGDAAMEIKTQWPVRPEAALYRVSADRVYFAICQRLDTNDDMEDFGLYQYIGGRLEKVCDFYSGSISSAHIFHYGAELVSVSGDKLVLRCANQFNATAYLHWEVEFAFRDGIWQPQGNVYPVVYSEYMADKADGMTANQPITVYTAIDCAKIAYRVEKGGCLFLDQLCIEAGEVFFHVTDGEGREGWLQDPDEVYANVDGEELFGLFEEAIFAG